MNNFAINTLKKIFLIFFFYILNGNALSNEFEIKAEKVNYQNTQGKIIAQGNASALNNDGKK